VLSLALMVRRTAEKFCGNAAIAFENGSAEVVSRRGCPPHLASLAAGPFLGERAERLDQGEARAEDDISAIDNSIVWQCGAALQSARAGAVGPRRLTRNHRQAALHRRCRSPRARAALHREA